MNLFLLLCTDVSGLFPSADAIYEFFMNQCTTIDLFFGHRVIPQQEVV